MNINKKQRLLKEFKKLQKEHDDKMIKKTMKYHRCKKTDYVKPKQKTEQIERGENWIVEFWRARGFEVVKTALGISFSLHRKPEFENKGLGLDLTYLEQFAEEAIRLTKQNILNMINKARDEGNIEGEKGFSAGLFLSELIKYLEGK